MNDASQNVENNLIRLDDMAKACHFDLEAFAENLRKQKQPVGNLRAVTRKKGFQYYITTQKGDTKGKYVSRKNLRKAAAIAQRDYNAQVLSSVEKQASVIRNFLAAFHPLETECAYANLHPGRRALIDPVYSSDDEYVYRWSHLPYTGKGFEVNAPEYYASDGTRVRSKSEIIIADALVQAGVPYRYEYPTSVRGWGTLYPDFTCLKKSTREEFVWEHFGMMDDLSYVKTFMQKMMHYASNDYIFGKNFIATFESGSAPLSVKLVNKYIKAYFL